MGKLDPDDPRPPYQQIADHLRNQIATEEIAAGMQLPALARLASDYGVSIGTAKSAIGVLRGDGLVVTRQGKGTYVRTNLAGKVSDDAGLDEVRAALANLAARLDKVEQRLADL